MLNAEILDSTESDLRALGKNEKWLHDWIIGKPLRLGLGQIEIKAHELIQSKNSGGRLDILAYNASDDTYYEIEVMLGECDASHGFRTLDYWARERAANPDSRHIAVLVAENLQGRYKTVLETLPQFIPFIGIEIHTLLLAGDPPQATIRPTILYRPDDLLTASKQGTKGTQDGIPLVPRDEETWRDEVTDKSWQTMHAIYTLAQDDFGQTKIDYSGRSYVGLWKGKRCWCPMWPTQDGVRLYLPDGGVGQDSIGEVDGMDTTTQALADPGTKDQPSARFEQVKKRLALLHIDANWTWSYNQGANPVAFTIRLQDVASKVVQDILKHAHAAI